MATSKLAAVSVVSLGQRGSGVVAMPGWRSLVALVAVLAALGATGCGGAGANTTGAPAKQPLASASPSPPRGGPVPTQLAGSWLQVAASWRHLRLSGTEYTIGEGDYSADVRCPTEGVVHATGCVAVNGSEIAFYNGNGTPCQALGRFRWGISGGILTFTSPNSSDECPWEGVLDDPQGWQKSP